MQVGQILKSKETPAVEMLGRGATIAEAARLLSEKRIGTVVVSDGGGRADGILSERDIVRELGKRGPDVLQDTVGALMTANPVTCTADHTGEEVLQLMTDGRFRHLPVVDDAGAMIGLISIGDVVKARLSELSMERDALEGMIRGH